MQLFRRGPAREEAQPQPAQPEAGLEVRLPGPTATVEVSVTRAGEEAPPSLVTMYRDGIPVRVPPESVAHFQALGFVLYAPTDLPALAREIGLMIAPLGPAITAFVDKALADGVIDPDENAELTILTRLWSEIGKKLELLLNTAYQSFPVKERAP